MSQEQGHPSHLDPDIYAGLGLAALRRQTLALEAMLTPAQRLQYDAAREREGRNLTLALITLVVILPALFVAFVFAYDALTTADGEATAYDYAPTATASAPPQGLNTVDCVFRYAATQTPGVRPVSLYEQERLSAQALAACEADPSAY